MTMKAPYLHKCRSSLLPTRVRDRHSSNSIPTCRLRLIKPTFGQRQSRPSLFLTGNAEGAQIGLGSWQRHLAAPSGTSQRAMGGPSGACSGPCPHTTTVGLWSHPGLSVQSRPESWLRAAGGWVALGRTAGVPVCVWLPGWGYRVTPPGLQRPRLTLPAAAGLPRGFRARYPECGVWAHEVPLHVTCVSVPIYVSFGANGQNISNCGFNCACNKKG